MSPASPHTLDRARIRGVMAWALFGALLIGQVGLGAGLLLIGEAIGRGACEASCHCDDDAMGAEDGLPSVALDEGPAGGDALDVPCPPSCDDCTCCPGAVPVILSAGFAVLRPALALPVARPPPEMPVTGVMARVFRPPEPCQS